MCCKFKKSYLISYKNVFKKVNEGKITIESTYVLQLGLCNQETFNIRKSLESVDFPPLFLDDRIVFRVKLELILKVFYSVINPVLQ